jgi:pimeloyl-ACP methyl ester carboxylesterase
MWFTEGMETSRGAGVTGRRIHGAGLELALTERGDTSRPTVVLVHGFPDTSAVWTPLAELLAGDFHVVTYDVRGAGASDTPRHRSEYSLPFLVDDLAAVISAVSPATPVHLVAHDWGSIQGWEAVTTDRLAGRFASYTSISGPPLDHAALWARSHRSWHLADLRAALGQALHSWYIAFFHLPFLPELMARGGRNRQLWARALHRIEGAPVDPTWPAATFGDDFAHGVNLYRANVSPRFRHPTAGHTETPVQIIVPLKDRYVTPALLDGLESWSSTVWRRPIATGHWAIRTHPAELSQWIRDVMAYVEEGVEAPDLARCRLRPGEHTGDAPAQRTA